MKRVNMRKAKKSHLEQSNKSWVKSSLTKLNSNPIIPIFVAALILILALSLLIFQGKTILSPGELSVERTLPTSAQINQQFTVTLQVYTAADKPAALGITEIVPAGLIIEIEDVQLNNLGNDNLEFYRKINNGELEILVFSLFTNVTDFIITYTITPTTTSASFSGTWESVDPDSSGNIAGDTSLTINTGSGGSSPGGAGGGGGGGGATTPTTTTQPRTNQTCQENWLCSDWTECENEIQTRTCTDTSACGTSTTKPIEQASCNPVIKAAEQAVDYSLRRPALPISVLLIAIIIVVIVIIIIIKKRRR